MSVDREVVKSVKEGSVRAFELVYTAYVDRVYRFLYTLLRSGEDAREATQDVFVKLWDSREQLQEDRELAFYLFAICRNHALNILRKRKSQAGVAEEYQRDQPLMALSAEEGTEDTYSVLLEEAIETLPPRRKRIFELCKIQGLSYKQVASTLQISDGTVEVQVAKAMKQIRLYMVKQDVSRVCE
ncbi:RNA polymerase sigma factor [Parachryseolinea silvisoli]|jgi:RNA polymerase sigma-70 factor (family 1)|uniref:RNA polymerase sigma factor n=1 Tax=Parachryseolinea silvisoli TaxID=2873601 RepID=UPI002265AB80|nr:RNA polymerase sigma-70 factor [Parachryseolinea silvisoli]MCD9019106.1 RNA polymerase sigma-70 factor [Parachryseolinea silvisoli]